MTQEKNLVLPLLFVALFANLFLFGVAYTNASFNGAERALPDLGMSRVTYQLDNVITTAQQNFVWAVSTSVALVKPEVVAVLGLQDYKYGAPRYTALTPTNTSLALTPLSSPAPSVAYAENSAGTGQVLGAYIVNPSYALSAR